MQAQGHELLFDFRNQPANEGVVGEEDGEGGGVGGGGWNQGRA